MSRRWLGRLAVTVLVLDATPTRIGTGTPSPDESRLLVTVGETTAASTRLWLRAEADVARVRVTSDAGAPPFTYEARPDPARDHTAVLVLDGFRPGGRYAYAVEAGGARVSGAFTTSPAADADRTVRLQWSGDLGGAGYGRDGEGDYRIFRAMTRRAPDLFLFVGDTIYADQACGGAAHVPAPVGVASTLADFRVKHRYNRADPMVQAFFRTTSVYPIWDDHEVRNNFGPEVPLMPVGRRAFQEPKPGHGSKRSERACGATTI